MELSALALSDLKALRFARIGAWGRVQVDLDVIDPGRGRASTDEFESAADGVFVAGEMGLDASIG
jgi:hypothetical protein